MPDYHLMKVGLAESFLHICQNICNMESGRRTLETGVFSARRRFLELGGCLARRRRKKQLQQESRLLAKLLQEMEAGQDIACFVCEETIPYFAGRGFNGYFEADWVRHMLRYGGYADAPSHIWSGKVSGAAGEAVSAFGAGIAPPLPHFVILGQAYCVPEILYEHVRGMKSLKWILPKRQFREEQQELVDLLYEEYGLAVEVRLLLEEESYKLVHPVCRMPSLVLDFSEADRIPTADVARGSIWLDMASSEEKRRRIEDRDTGIYYFSLKKEWKQPQKALNYLDTIGKNGYNT